VYVTIRFPSKDYLTKFDPKSCKAIRVLTKLIVSQTNTRERERERERERGKRNKAPTNKRAKNSLEHRPKNEKKNRGK
jgi:hypothetical protein